MDEFGCLRGLTHGVASFGSASLVSTTTIVAISIDQETANAGAAHLSEGDLLAGEGGRPIEATLRFQVELPPLAPHS